LTFHIEGEFDVVSSQFIDLEGAFKILTQEDPGFAGGVDGEFKFRGT
jgi:hypothetical protein